MSQGRDVAADITERRAQLKAQGERMTAAFNRQTGLLAQAAQVLERAKDRKETLIRRRHDAAVVAEAGEQLGAFLAPEGEGDEAAVQQVVAQAQAHAALDGANGFVVNSVEHDDLDGYSTLSDEAAERNDDSDASSSASIDDDRSLSDFEADEIETMDAQGASEGVAGFYNIWAEVNGTATPQDKFAEFKEMVLKDSAVEADVSVKEQHELEMAQMQSALEGINSEDKGILATQLSQYHLDCVAQNPAIDPELYMDSMLARQDQVASALVSQLPAELQGAAQQESARLAATAAPKVSPEAAKEFIEAVRPALGAEIEAAGGEEAFIAQQAELLAATPFYNKEKSPTKAPEAGVALSK